MTDLSLWSTHYITYKTRIKCSKYVNMIYNEWSLPLKHAIGKAQVYAQVNLDGNRLFKVHRYFQSGLEMCS